MMTIHKLSAGDGYLYYTREIATGDERRSGRRELDDYYTADGNPPGVWVGAGSAELGVSGTVTEAQMRALYGEGLHPNADRIIEHATAQGLSPAAAVRSARLGRRYYRYDQTEGPLAARIAGALQDFESREGRPPTDPERKRLRAKTGAVAFRQDFGRSPKSPQELNRYIAAHTTCTRQAVAGYDLVFRNKYGSILWALGDDETRRQVEAAHEQSIAETLTWIENNALATRTGVNGIAQEDVRGGLIAAQYRHYDSRRGDPLLHDHVVVANKVRGLDGRWRSIDGKLLYAMGVAASELYNQRVVEELCRRLDVRTEEREVTPGKRPVMAIAGLDDDLVNAFSKRAHDIRADLHHLLDAYRSRHGREPDTTARLALIQQAAQQTRPPKKKARALSDLRAAWHHEAVTLIGAPRTNTLLRHAQQTAAASPPPPAVDIPEAAADVLHTVSAERAVWGRRHVLAEARRHILRLTGGRGDTTELAERITQHALDHGSLNITPPDLHAPFPPLLRADGTSIYRRRESELYTSTGVLAAESRILHAAHRTVIPALTADRFTTVADHFDDGPPLDPGQRHLAHTFACSDKLLAVGVGPAGSGKTTALRLVRDAVADSGARLIPLAPSSRAAKVLEDDLAAPAHTLHGWLAQRTRLAEGRRVRRTFLLHPGDVIVVDEAGMAGTHNLARVVAEAEAAGALVRLLGDPAQLGSVESGGALRLLTREVGAAELEILHRFRAPGEADATLALRDGDPAHAWRWHLANHRIVGGDPDTMLDSLFTAWQNDTSDGLLALMIADDTDNVRVLNARAQAFQLISGHLDPTRSTALRDELHAHPGDLVITRRNERRLPVHGGRDFVKNGDQWRVERIDRHGNATVRHTTHHGRVVLPAVYLTRHTELGYASTTHRAQGLTVDTAHGLVSARTSRASAYVMATRGRHANHLYAITTDDHTTHDVLATIADSARPTLSAHETIRTIHDDACAVTHLAAEYADVYARADSHRLERLTRRALGNAAEPILCADAWPALQQALRTAEAEGWNPVRLLTSAHTEHHLTNTDAHTDDPAALLTWRITTRITEGRATAQRAAERESTPGASRPLKHLTPDLLARLADRAERIRRSALDDVHHACARTTPSSPVSAPAWSNRPHGHLISTALATAIADARTRMRRALLEDDPTTARSAAAEHTTLCREQRLRRTMPRVDRLREDCQRELRHPFAHAPCGHPSTALERLHRASTISARIHAEQRLRNRLPDAPPPTPDHSGPLPDWLAPSAALRDPDTSASWRHHLGERRTVLAQRLTHTGALLATHPPTWTRPLGPVPAPGSDLRTQWEHTAALTHAWRTLHGIHDGSEGIGEQPDHPQDPHAWASLHDRITTLGRRTRALTAARTRVTSPGTATHIAARTACALQQRMLNQHSRDKATQQTLTATARAFSDIALHHAMTAQEPPASWLRHIPAPDASDPRQQNHWRQLVTAVTLWRTLHPTTATAPVGEAPNDVDLHPLWTDLRDAVTLFQRARIQQRLTDNRLRQAARDTPNQPRPSPAPRRIPQAVEEHLPLRPASPRR
ncbi:MobF family relaxase [Streptomyces sp. 4N509B]|uniref:MobF family relaxase n=1 Tax=Streptomyces sp. 4N509B TaxID=3457413 RepID=UPI003FD6B57A